MGQTKILDPDRPSVRAEEARPLSARVLVLQAIDRRGPDSIALNGERLRDEDPF